jgi:hypothetical protein
MISPLRKGCSLCAFVSWEHGTHLAIELGDLSTLGLGSSLEEDDEVVGDDDKGADLDDEPEPLHLGNDRDGPEEGRPNPSEVRTDGARDELRGSTREDADCARDRGQQSHHRGSSSLFLCSIGQHWHFDGGVTGRGKTHGAGW